MGIPQESRFGLVAAVSPLTMPVCLLVPVSCPMLWCSRFGLRLRLGGENPITAVSLGVDVVRYKYIGVIVAGALAGIGGAARTDGVGRSPRRPGRRRVCSEADRRPPTEGSPMITVEWDELRSKAVEAAAKAYCPYSNLRVGAAAMCDDGRIVVGCNVENGSYGVTLCAECAMAGQLMLTGGGRFVAVACRSGTGELLMPCGRCRQVIQELGGSDCLVDTPRGVLSMREVLPDAFET